MFAAMYRWRVEPGKDAHVPDAMVDRGGLLFAMPVDAELLLHG